MQRRRTEGSCGLEQHRKPDRIQPQILKVPTAWPFSGLPASAMRREVHGRPTLFRMSMTTTSMKQIALDIGLASDPSFANFFSGPNEAAVAHLKLWADNPLR